MVESYVVESVGLWLATTTTQNFGMNCVSINITN